MVKNKKEIHEHHHYPYDWSKFTIKLNGWPWTNCVEIKY